MKIGEIRQGMRRVDTEGTVVEISEVRNVTLRTGRPARVADAIIKDETGTIKLSLWNEDIDRVKVGDKVRIENGYTTTFRGEIQLNVGRYGTLHITK